MSKSTIAVVLLSFLLGILFSRTSGAICADYYRLFQSTYPNITTLFNSNYTFVGRWIEPGASIPNSGRSPKPNIVQADLIHIRFTGTLVPPVTGWYQFRYYVDDTLRFYVDDLVNPLISVGVTEFTARSEFGIASKMIYFEANTSHPIVVDVGERRGAVGLSLSWAVYQQNTNTSQMLLSDQVVPNSAWQVCNTTAPTFQIFTPPPLPQSQRDAFQNAIASADGLCSHYYIKNSFRQMHNSSAGDNPPPRSIPDYFMSRVDPTISFTFPRYDPLPGLPTSTTRPPGFAFISEGFIIPERSTNYTFYIFTGTDLRFYINDRLLIDVLYVRTEIAIRVELSTPSIWLDAGVLYRITMHFGESQFETSGTPYDTSRDLTFSFDWVWNDPVDGIVRRRVPTSALKTISCPSTTTPLILRSNLTGSTTLSDGSYSVNGSLTVSGNLTLAGASLIIGGASSATISGQINLDGNSTLVLRPGGAMNVSGDVTFADGSTISITSSGSQNTPIVVSGTVKATGTEVTVVLTNGSSMTLRETGTVTIPFLSWTSSEGLDVVVTNATADGLRECEKVTSRVNYGTKDLSLVFSLDSSGCTPPSDSNFPLWAIAPIVGGVILIAAGIGAIVYIVNRQRNRASARHLSRKLRSSAVKDNL